MRTSIQVLGAAAAVMLVTATPALAGWNLVGRGSSAEVAKGLVVSPGEDWNRNSHRPIKKGETWTLDGTTLNELYFVSGLVAGDTLFKDRDKKNRPLPKMGAAMALTDIPEFFESSARIQLNTSLFQLGTVTPAKLGGHDAVRFEYTYSAQGEQLTRRGLATGAVVAGKLYLINFAAPSIYYYDRDAPKVEAIVASARI